MIDRVHFENFKSLADVTIDLGRFTVLVGPNGCGKSSVLEAVNALAMTGLSPGSANETASRLGRFGLYFQDSLDPARIARTASEPSLIAARQDGSELAVQFRPVADGEYDVEVSVTGARGGLSTKLPSNWSDALAVLNHSRVRAFCACVYMQLDPSRMTHGNVPDEVEPRLRQDGSNLSSVLAWMKGSDEERLERITTDLAAVVPGVQKVRIRRKALKVFVDDGFSEQGVRRLKSDGTGRIADTFEIEFGDKRAIPADLLSEGTVLALGLLTKLHERNRPRLVLLDDVDRGLHLAAQAELIARLRSLLDAQPDLQIVCTTHSPYLLDLFKPEEVRVMALDSERRTRVRALSEHPDIEQWKFGTQTGELWATLGEAWVLEAGGG